MLTKTVITTLMSLLCSVTICQTQSSAAELLVEAESFAAHGGWQLDTQFIQQMGSPYLLAHGLGKPVADASTTVDIKQAGNYVVWVRTYDWVARWKATGSPGRFQLFINDSQVGEDLGTAGEKWQWQKAGKAKLSVGEAKLRLHDLTGFDGRCDAIYLTTDESATPDNSEKVLPPWRRKLLGLEAAVEEHNDYDLVVVGGGYSGMGAAISAARMGCKVALIQDRGVLGGNGSSEVRVWAMGLVRRGKFPRIGEIVEEFADKAKKSPGYAESLATRRKKRSFALKRTSISISIITPLPLKRLITRSSRSTQSMSAPVPSVASTVRCSRIAPATRGSEPSPMRAGSCKPKVGWA